jgi:hypothetical protein
MIGNVFGDGLLMIGAVFDDDNYLRIVGDFDWLVIGALVWLDIQLMIGTDFDDEENYLHLISRVWSWRKFLFLEGLALDFS